MAVKGVPLLGRLFGCDGVGRMLHRGIEQSQVLHEVQVVVAARPHVEDKHQPLGVAVEPHEAGHDALQPQSFPHRQQSILLQQIGKDLLVKSQRRHGPRSGTSTREASFNQSIKCSESCVRHKLESN